MSKSQSMKKDFSESVAFCVSNLPPDKSPPQVLDIIQNYTSERCPRGRWLVLKSKIKNEKHLRMVFVSCHTWSCPVCGPKKTKWLRRRLRKVASIDRLNFLSFTLRQNDDDLLSNYKRISECFQKFVKEIKKTQKKVIYFKIFEMQKNGTPHLHVLANIKRTKRQLHDMWYRITGDSYEADIRYIKYSAVGYVTKYLTKISNTASEFKEGGLKYYRVYSTTRGFFIVEKKESTWKLVFQSNNRKHCWAEFRSAIMEAWDEEFQQGHDPTIHWNPLIDFFYCYIS